MMIRWIFFDVGNVLLDEDPLTFFVFRRHVEAIRRLRPDRSFEALLAEREARASAGSRWPLADVVSRYLDEDEAAATWAEIDRETRARYAELSPPIPGAAGQVERLARRFRLGLIANQPREGRDRLAALGLLDRFEVAALSEEEGLFKPDPALYRRAIGRAGIAPAEALMVGDRPDNDIAPAGALGLATALVRWPRRTEKGWTPDDPEALAYRRSLERIAARVEAGTSARPSLTVDGVEELEDAIKGWLPTETVCHFGVEST